MSRANYTVSLAAETAERLEALAEAQGVAADDAIAQAIADYLEAWEDHLHDLDDDERENLPWLARQG